MNEFHKTPRDSERDALLRNVSTYLPRRKDTMPCPDDSRLAALAEGKIHGLDRMQLVDHLATCDRCRESFSLLRYLMPPVPGRKRIFRPLALAASLVLVVMMVYVTTSSDTPRRESFVPPSAPISTDEKTAAPSSVEPVLQPAAQQHKVDPASPKREKYKQSLPVAFGSTGRDKKAIPSEKRMQAPPVEKRIKEEREPPVDSEDTSALMTLEKSPAPAMKKVHSAQDTADTLQERKGEIAPVSGIFPEPPPVETPPGRVQFAFFLSEKGEITGLTFDPGASPLVPPLRRALRQWRPRSAHGSQRLRFEAIWDGNGWKIQPSSISGGKRPGTSGT